MCKDYLLSFYCQIGINAEHIGEGANDDGYTDDYEENEEENDDEYTYDHHDT